MEQSTQLVVCIVWAWSGHCANVQFDYIVFGVRICCWRGFRVGPIKLFEIDVFL